MVTDFGKQIKHRLVDMDQTQEWLAKEVRKKTISEDKPKGMFVDSGYIQKIMKGERKPKKIIDAICEVLDIAE